MAIYPDTGEGTKKISGSGGSATCTIFYDYPKPSTPQVTYDASEKKFTVTWSAYTGFGVSSGITYTILYGDWEDGYQAYSKYVGSGTSTTIDYWHTASINNSHDFYFTVVAKYGEDEATSDYATCTVYGYYLSWDDNPSNVTLSQYSGNSLKVSWTAPTIMKYSGTAPIYYVIKDWTTDTTATVEGGTTGYLPIGEYDTELSISIIAICESLG